MKFNYFPDTDTLYIDLVDRPSVDSDEVSPGVVLDMDADGNIVGIGIERAPGIGIPRDRKALRLNTIRWTLQLPHLYPTPDGGIQAECNLRGTEISLAAWDVRLSS